ncbi:hypothetical protein L3Q82_023490 [Scortum barcoo]|uniref:Uncharacterized protein n=1 Tax=Scortum barcoo TaxID=214431 RepID=A0ACB8WT44_9TELE|nr:hypothetical protein L3Q82_023490 [Scortum barcoo]
MNTMFEHKGVHQCTWHQDTLSRRSMIDFVVVSSDLRPYVLDTRVKRGAELSTDHHLVVSWIRWQRRKLDRPGRPKRIVRVCWERLAEPSVREVFNSHLRKSFSQIPTEAGDIESKWTMFSASIVDAAVRSCGRKVTGSKGCCQTEEGVLSGMLACGTPDAVDGYLQVKQAAALDGPGGKNSGLGGVHGHGGGLSVGLEEIPGKPSGASEVRGRAALTECVGRSQVACGEGETAAVTHRQAADRQTDTQTGCRHTDRQKDVFFFLVVVVVGGQSGIMPIVSSQEELEKLTRRHAVKVLPQAGCSVEEVGYAVGEVVGFESVKSTSCMNSAVVKVERVVEAGIVLRDTFTPVYQRRSPLMGSTTSVFVTSETMKCFGCGAEGHLI